MRLSRNKVETAAVSTSFEMSFAGGHADEKITATLTYNVWEPFAVTANFTLGASPAVQWVMSRDLLREGVVLPTGLGDIRVYPASDGIFVELNSPSGRAVLHGPIEPVIDFVTRIYATVPEVRELEFFSVDSELELLADLHRNPDNGHQA